MKSLIVVVLVAWGSLAASSQIDTQDYFSEGLTNGRGWRIFSNLSKSLWIDAYNTGATSAAAQMTENNPKCSMVVVKKSLNQTLKIKETVEGIDFFYQDPTNLRIPLVIAVDFLADKMNGTSAVELDRMLTIQRRRWNKH